MLSTSDADLARRDSAIPGLVILLDPEAFRQAASYATGREITGARASYVRYKPGMNCLVAYELEVNGQKVMTYAKGHRADAADQLKKAEDVPNMPGILGSGRVTLPDQAIVLTVFPNDGELKTLARLGDEETCGALLRRMFPERSDLWGGTLRHIRYKPERRYVTQLLVGNEPRAVLKVYTSTGYAEAKSGGRAFKSSHYLSTPKRIGHSDRHLVLAFEWMEGCLLSDAMASPDLGTEALERVGRALVDVHAGRAGRLAQYTREAEASGLMSVAAGLGFLCPELRGRVEALAREMALMLMRQPAMNTPIHGDFYGKQVLLNGEKVVILDFDSAAAGDPAADLGLFIAHLERGALRRSLPSDKVHPYADALLNGYTSGAQSWTPERVRLYTAASLLRLSPHPFRNRHPNWPEQIGATIARAEEIFREVKASRFFVEGAGRQTQSGQQRLPGDEKAEALKLSAVSDPTMTFMAQAINPFDVHLQFRRRLASWLGEGSKLEVPGIRVVRHKPGRRCLVEYDLLIERAKEAPQAIILMGKARARGLDRTTYETMLALSNAGFGYDSEDGISVPQPVGVVPEFQMWLHRKVPGTLATQLLAEHGGTALAERIGEALQKLHSTRVKCSRRHTVADELSILHEKLPLVARDKPEWSGRIERLLSGCDRLGAKLDVVTPRGIHRDFYADHVLQDGNRIYLLDFDLYCMGDPALDPGNFVGHMQEWALRRNGGLHKLAEREEALIEQYLKLSRDVTRRSVEIYTHLTMVRHVYLSTQFADRQQITEALLEECEMEQARLLGVGSRKIMRMRTEIAGIS